MRLPGAMVGILPENHRAHVAVGSMPECVENILHRRIDPVCGILLLEEFTQLKVVILSYLVRQECVPLVAYMHHFFLLLPLFGFFPEFLVRLGLTENPKEPIFLPRA